jgi:hypothetical protein
MVDRSTAEAPCPGSSSNFVVILDSVWKCQWDLGHPRNIGTCTLYLDPLDGAGKSMGVDFTLNPGDQVPWVTPPPGTAQLAIVCDSSCSGRAILEYDTPSA